MANARQIIADKLKKTGTPKAAPSQEERDKAHAEHVASLKKSASDYLKKASNSIYKKNESIDEAETPDHGIMRFKYIDHDKNNHVVSVGKKGVTGRSISRSGNSTAEHLSSYSGHNKGGYEEQEAAFKKVAMDAYNKSGGDHKKVLSAIQNHTKEHDRWSFHSHGNLGEETEVDEAVKDYDTLKRKPLNQRSDKDNSFLAANKPKKNKPATVEVHIKHEDGTISKEKFKHDGRSSAEEVGQNHLKHMQVIHSKFGGFSKPESVHKAILKENNEEMEQEDLLVEELNEMLGAGMGTKDVHKHLKKLGWEHKRSKGGHDIFTHEKSTKNIAVPRHKGDLSAPTVIAIMKSAKIGEEMETLSFNEYIAENEKQLQHDYVKQTLADHDINASIKNGKVVVHKDHVEAAKGHLDKLGYGNMSVVHEEVEEQIDERSEYDANNHLAAGTTASGKKMHYLKRDGKRIGDGHESSDAALKAWQGLSDRKGVKIVHEDVEELDEHVEVHWVDREYKTHKKVFKSDPNGPADNHYTKAKKFADSLDADHKKSKYGTVRNVKIHRVNEGLVEGEFDLDMIKEDLSDRLYAHVDSHRKSGKDVKVTNYGRDGRSATFISIDKDGTKRKHTVTMTGTKHEVIEKGEKEEPSNSTEKRGRGRPVGSKSGARA
jgi:predicted RNA binding protein YcfA (HicA-like mRNA interferase family)